MLGMKEIEEEVQKSRYPPVGVSWFCNNTSDTS